ncbi:hypothetical protein Hanom_Chr17g01584181 [Helianthus anomalus]
MRFFFEQIIEFSKFCTPNITDKWLRPKADCSEQDMVSRSSRLSLDSFLGIFLIAGVSPTCALIIYLFIFLYENKGMLLSDGSIR